MDEGSFSQDYMDQIRQKIKENGKYRRPANIMGAANQGEPRAIDMILKLNQEPTLFWKYNIGLN